MQIYAHFTFGFTTIIGMKQETLSLINHTLKLDNTISPERAERILRACQGILPPEESLRPLRINDYCRSRGVSRSQLYANLNNLGYHRGYKDFAGRLLPEVVAALDGYGCFEVEECNHGNIKT